MFAKRFIYFLLISSAVVSCKKDDSKPAPSKSELLAGQTSKSWIIVKITPEDETEDASCHLASVQNADNYWIFTAGGSFEYNHGVILEDPNCTTDCCSDLANLYGKRSLYNSDANLKVHIVGRIDSGVKTEFPLDQQMDLLDATITTLTSTKLSVTKDGNVNEFAVH